MEQATEKDFYFYMGQFWPVVAVGLIIYLGGEATKKVIQLWVPAATPVARQPFWYRLWCATIDWHPIAVGGLLGAIPWPTPSFVMHWWVRVLWFAFVGACSGQIYRSVKKTLDALPELARKQMGLPQQAESSSDGDSEGPRA